MPHKGCADFHRSHPAVAGDGLPAIEPGMPQPAGTGLSRRRMLLGSIGLGLSIYGADKLKLAAFEAGIANAQASAPDAPVLISIFLDGGADSLSVLAPVADPRYRTLRPRLALPLTAGTPFSEDPRLRWHPSLGGLATLHAEGKVGVLPAVGYTDANQSHFTSRHFWEVGATDVGGSTGWMGRYLDIAGTADNPLQGLSLDWRLSPTLATAGAPVATAGDPTDYDFWVAWVDDPTKEAMLSALATAGAAPSGSTAERQARGAVAAAMRLRTQLRSVGTPSTQGYPTDSYLARRLSAIPAMLASGLPLRCVAMSADGGFDTHADQPASFASDLQVLGDSLLAFQRDLERRGLADRVLVLVWSEFGRRPEENDSQGTDHGAAGTAFVVGSRAAGRMIGEFPGLTELDEDDNLRATSDFRAVYCSLLEQWLGVEAARVIPFADQFARPTLVT